MSLLKDLKDWREPLTGAVSNQYKPGDYSCDNGIDFTAIAVRLGAISKKEFGDMCNKYSRSSGEFMRYPSADTSMSWDDHNSAAAVHKGLAHWIRVFGRAHSWTWDKGTKKLWRFPIFIPTVYASADGRLNVFLQALAALAYIANSFEGKEHTSGKKSLWIAQEALYGKGFIINKSIEFWRWAQMKRYPGGIREVFKTYFGVGHPYSLYAPEDFK